MVEANEKLKHQYAHKLCDQYYTAISHSAFQTLGYTESFMQFHGHLGMTFGSWSKLGRISFQATSVKVSSLLYKVLLVYSSNW